MGKVIITSIVYITFGLAIGLLISTTTLNSQVTSLENQVCELSRSLTATEFFLQEEHGIEWNSYKQHMKAVYQYEFRNCEPITKKGE